MNIKKSVVRSLLAFVVLAELAVAAPVVREASFHRLFDGKDYYINSSGKKVDMTFKLSTMSGDGKVVAFYGDTLFDSVQHRTLFIHNFESTAEPVEVVLPSDAGALNTAAGLVSNEDGSRIFFTAHKVDNTYINIFYRVNGLTGVVTELFRGNQGDIEYPQDIATDAAGKYLYFNESDNGDRGDLWRIQASGGAVPELVIRAAGVSHPSGGYGRFIDQFDISDDGKTIAFFIEGRIEGDTTTRTDKELFVKTESGIKNLTNNTQNDKGDLVISGDASTIVYTGSPSGGSWSWMVTSPGAALESQKHIEMGYYSCGDRPGITRDGTVILGSSAPNGTSSCSTYLIQTDGSSRLMVNPGQINIRATSENGGLHLSDDGKRTFFKNRWYVYPEEWHNMTAGVFGPNLWPTEVPSVTGVSYSGDMYIKLEDNEQFEVKIAVSDPQDVIVEDGRVKENTLFPNGYEDEDRGAAAPLYLSMHAGSVSANLYTAGGQRGSAWPDRVPTMTARFSVLDDDFNVGYVDTLVQPPLPSDFTANGSNDLLWRKANTGAIKIMQMNGTTPGTDISVVTSSNTNLLPRGIGDFTGDGKPDILFHNQNSGNLRIWEMDGTTKVNNIQVLGSSNTNLKIAGVGDFDLNGDNDIAVFNTNSGALRIWVMEGTTRVNNILVLTGANTNLVPSGVGDMDGDGIPDIVLRNNNSGVVRVWTMSSDFTRKGNEYVIGSSNTNLELRGVMDINSDGNGDILNYNTNTGKLRAWLMDGNLSITENAEIVQDLDLDWSVRN